MVEFGRKDGTSKFRLDSGRGIAEDHSGAQARLSHSHDELKYFCNIQDAIDAVASSGDTVTLNVSSVCPGLLVEEGKDVTLDLAGLDLSFERGTPLFECRGSGKVEISAGAFGEDVSTWVGEGFTVAPPSDGFYRVKPRVSVKE